MNAQHTPGPWRYNPDRICIESETAWSIKPDPANDEEGSRVSVVHTQGAMGGNVEADLRLIAASPTMYAALERAAHALSVAFDATQDPAIGDVEVAVLAALSLARGS